MDNIKVAVAQVSSIKGNVEANIEVHLKALIKASQLGVNYLVFPELSLTGYEPELALALAFDKNDKRLNTLIDASIKYNITIAIGAPLSCKQLPKIALFILYPSGCVDVYEKMYLHSGEALYFSEGHRHHHIEIHSTKIVNAICADTNHLEHVKYCTEINASIYIAGVLISESGYVDDVAALQSYAKNFNLLVAIANHNKPSGGWKPIGRSAMWSSSGLLAQANETQDALLVAERKDNQWTAQVYEIE